MRLFEFSSTTSAVIDILVKKGYKKLGVGVDQTAFLEPKTGLVLKIFGMQPGTGTRKFSNDQKMFIFWADYCKSNVSNPFLPKFTGWETFDFNGEKYLQIRMERLGKVPSGMSTALEELATDNEVGLWLSHSPADADKLRAKYKSERAANIGNDSYYNQWYKKQMDDPGRVAHSELAILLGEDYKLLLKTLEDIFKIAKTKQWGYDLHAGNFMVRRDGTPVIVDPWVVPRPSRFR